LRTTATLVIYSTAYWLALLGLLGHLILGLAELQVSALPEPLRGPVGRGLVEEDASGRPDASARALAQVNQDAFEPRSRPRATRHGVTLVDARTQAPSTYTGLTVLSAVWLLVLVARSNGRRKRGHRLVGLAVESPGMRRTALLLATLGHALTLSAAGLLAICGSDCDGAKHIALPLLGALVAYVSATLAAEAGWMRAPMTEHETPRSSAHSSAAQASSTQE